MTTQHVIDDDMLSAWLDNGLDEARRLAVEDALREQPDMQQRLARLMINERRVRDHFSAMTQAKPPPDSMLALLETSGADSRAPGASNASAPRPWLLRCNDWILSVMPRPALAAGAMTLVLAIGLVLGRQAGMDRPGADMPTAAIEAGHEWFALLESTASGKMLALGNGRTGQVALTYRDASGTWCRQFEVRDTGQATGSAAIACRQHDHWRIDLAQRLRVPETSAEYYQAASNNDLSAIDAFINNGIAGDALAGAAELELIQRQWP